MKGLTNVSATPEQLQIILHNRPGTVVIRGAAGSGKTTTVLLRLRSLVKYWINRRERHKLNDPVRILALTFNRTLKGYIEELAKQQIDDIESLEFTILTFGKWASDILGEMPADVDRLREKIINLGADISLNPDFLVDEVEYVTGRFLPEELEAYLDCERNGRGLSPRVDRSKRQQILEDVIWPYNAWKSEEKLIDWNDITVKLIKNPVEPGYDIIIVDEAQDFSANQIRAIKNQLAENNSLTFVLDAAQRIYPRGFTWKEAGIIIEKAHRLKKNYRNTVEIARFALPLLRNMKIEDDGTLPDFNSCEQRGPIPIILKGKFSKQMEFAIQYIQKNINLDNESVVFLHPKGGGWFSATEQYLDSFGLPYLHITRQTAWPKGSVNIALCTLHSAKGLEFDHVFVLGLNQEVTPHGEEEGDDQLNTLRRLLAMGISRARQSVILGYKPDKASSLVEYFDPATYREICV